MKKQILITFLLLAYTLMYAQKGQERITKNITAFTKLYGYVRWFHPSDEASKIDWNKLALYGINKVKDIQSEEKLVLTLDSIFNPIAPSMSLIKNGDNLIHNKNDFSKKNEIKPIYWQHIGVQLGKYSNKYRSFRVNRFDKNENISKLCYHKYFNEVYKYYNKKIRLSSDVKFKGGRNSYANLLLTLNKLEPHNVCRLDSVFKIKNDGWKNVVKYDTVLKTDRSIDIGIYIEGSGELFVDNLKLEYFENGKWKEIYNDDFEKYKKGVFHSEDVYIYRNEFQKEIINFKGNKKLRISSLNFLFDKIPKEFYKKRITKNYTIKVPIIVYGDKKHTYPIVEKKQFELSTSNITKKKVKLQDYLIADIIVYWNVMKYFCPFNDELNLNYEKILIQAINLTLNYPKDYVIGFNYIANKIKDSHTGLWTGHYFYDLPFYCELIDSNFYITNSDIKELKQGDRVISVDGVNPMVKYNYWYKKVIGSPQLKNKKTLKYWTNFKKEKNIPIVVLRNRDTIKFKIKTIKRNYSKNVSKVKSKYYKESNTLYVNLAHFEIEEYKKILEKNYNKKFILLDLRNGMNFSPWELTPSIYKKYKLRQELLTPNCHYPNEQIFEKIKPIKKIKIEDNKQTMGIIIDGSAISSHESYIDHFKDYNIGVVFGQNTGGVSGNINIIELPSRRLVYFTGEKVIYHNGKSNFIKGINPTYSISNLKRHDLKKGDKFIL